MNGWSIIVPGVIAVFNGERGGTKNTISYATQRGVTVADHVLGLALHGFQLTRPMRGVTATFCFVMRSSSIYWGGLYFYQHFSKLFTTNVAYFMQIIRRTSRKFYITSGSHYSTQRVHLPNHSLLLHLCAQFSCANHCRGSKISGCRTLSQLSSRAHL